MIILASKSPRRAVLLDLVAEFQVRPVDVTEEAPLRLAVPDALEVIARKKALAGSRKAPDDWILAADTVVHHKGQLLGKARSASEARMRLATLSGTTHFVTTGIALAHRNQAVDARSVTTEVTMARLPVDVLNAYIESESWVGKAGGYGIQDTALESFIEIKGSWSNVVGLPLAETVAMLREYDQDCQDAPDEVWLRDHNPFENPVE